MREPNARAEVGMTAAEIDALGYTIGTLKVVRFCDKRTDLAWYLRDTEEIGTIQTVLDGGTPAEPSEVLRVAREAFGGDCEVLW
jgi:hypothetical protein